MKRIWSIAVAVMFLVTVSAFAIGEGVKSKAENKGTKDNLYDQVELFADAIGIVKVDYVEEIDPKKMIYGSLKGMLESLDDYSQFMEPEEYNEIKVETKGEFGGLGVEISMRDGILTVITPIDGTPAQGAGVMPADKIVKIDGKITRDMNMSEAVKLMRGKPGTMVTLTIWREKEEKVLDIPIKRAMIQIHSVKKAELIEDKIGYIKLIEFQENTTRDLEDALRKLEKQGMEALILDLRYNPGGILDGALDVSERFLPKDNVIVSIKGREGKGEEFKSSGKFVHPDYPLIVLVNEGSASASEIVAGAVQDNKRGVVLGAKSFGKASVQTVVPLKDGSALRITTAYYYTPSGRLIKSEGIMPDVVVEQAPRMAENKSEKKEDIFKKLDEKDGSQTAPSVKEDIMNDNQLTAAVNLMKAIRVYKSRNM